MMTDQDSERIRESIEKEIETVVDEIAELEKLTQPIAPDSALGRLTRMDAINNQSVREGSLRAARMRLAKLRDAHARLTLPDFGLCARCRQPIPISRLLLIPESTACVRCAGR